jgi:hypothetical protein
LAIRPQWLHKFLLNRQIKTHTKRILQGNSDIGIAGLTPAYWISRMNGYPLVPCSNLDQKTTVRLCYCIHIPR